jgi:hypothetical protein
VDGTDLSKYPSACQERAPDSDVAPRGDAAAAFSMPLLLRSLKERTNGLRERCVRFEAKATRSPKLSPNSLHESLSNPLPILPGRLTFIRTGVVR